MDTKLPENILTHLDAEAPYRALRRAGVSFYLRVCDKESSWTVSLTPLPPPQWHHLLKLLRRPVTSCLNGQHRKTQKCLSRISSNKVSAFPFTLPTSKSSHLSLGFKCKCHRTSMNSSMVENFKDTMENSFPQEANHWAEGWSQQMQRPPSTPPRSDLP